MNYLKPFVIGSSFPVILIYLIFFPFTSNKRNFSCEEYVVIAPLYLGIMTMFAFFISKNFKLSLQQSLLYISILSAFLSAMYAKSMDSYSFKDNEWYVYYITIFLVYLFVFNILIPFLMKNC